LINIFQRAAVAALLAVLAGTGGCSWFGGDEKEAGEPAELVDIEPTRRIRKVWDSGLGEGTEFMRLALTPASDGTHLYAAASDGRVSAFNAASGERLWRKKTRLPLSGGPAVGNGYVVVGSTDGQVVALRADDGGEVWRVSVASEVLAAPAIGPNLAYVRTVDGKLIALKLLDGTQAWFVQQTMPRLSVRGTGSPVVASSMVICGFDNGRVAAYDINDGTQIWDLLLAPPSGRTEVERLSDLNGTVQVLGDDVYAVGYQGQLSALARESGQVLWTREASSYNSVGADAANLYVSTDNGEIVAVERRSGRELWRYTELRNRDLTAPTPFGSSVVVGDFEGYLHWFTAGSGEPEARVRAGSARITAAPLVVNDLIYALTDDGDLVAYRDATRPQEK
jgi:outer membrane protein assembly factor BamB